MSMARQVIIYPNGWMDECDTMAQMGNVHGLGSSFVDGLFYGFTLYQYDYGLWYGYMDILMDVWFIWIMLWIVLYYYTFYGPIKSYLRKGS